MKAIKALCLRLMGVALAVWYALVRLFVRRGNAVAFISREADSPTVEFQLISAELAARCPGTRQIFCCKRAAKAEIGLGYIKELHAQMKALAAARVAVVDTYCIPVSMLRHGKDLTVIQIWHALTIVKQFGWQPVGKPEGTDPVMAKAMRMHAGYDAVIAGSESMRAVLAQTMRQPIEKIYPLGLPLSDRLLSTDGEAIRRRFLDAHPEAEGRRIIVYVPTMRRNSPVPCEALINAIDPESECLFISLHPVDLNTRIQPREGVIMDSTFTSQEAVFFADAVITDYSGTCAEAALAGKPLLFYVPDIEEYKAVCGLNVDPEVHYPALTFREESALLSVIRSEACDPAATAALRENLVGSCDGRSTQRIVSMIEKALDGIKPEAIDNEDKDTEHEQEAIHNRTRL